MHRVHWSDVLSLLVGLKGLLLLKRFFAISVSEELLDVQVVNASVHQKVNANYLIERRDSEPVYTPQN